jgi:flagellar biosynthesis protein FlhF
VKFASDLTVRQRKKIAILTTDNKKVGSAEQLKVYAQILNVPFAIVRNKEDWAIVKERFNQFDHILVDTPDINFNNLLKDSQSVELLPPQEFIPVNHFVQSLLSKDEKSFKKVEQFLKLNISDVIFTKLDESSEHGFIYNFHKKYKLPLHSFSIGDSIPEDYEYATKERVVDLLFKMTKMTNKKGL